MLAGQVHKLDFGRTAVKDRSADKPDLCSCGVRWRSVRLHLRQQSFGNAVNFARAAVRIGKFVQSQNVHSLGDASTSQSRALRTFALLASIVALKKMFV